MKKLNIVFLDFDDIKNPLLGAGQAKATLEVGKRLAEKGHTVTVIASKYPGYKSRKENGINYKHIGVGTNNIKLNNLIYILSIPFITPFINADVILECFTAPVSTLFSPLFTKIPVIGLSTSFEAERFSQKYHLPFAAIEKFGMRFYKYFIALTDYFGEKIQQVNPNTTVKVIPEGVEEAFFTYKSKKAKHILFIGRFDIGQKGIDLLLEAYAKIAKKAPYPLIIAGKGPDEEAIKELIKKYGLTNSVKMVGPAFGKKKEKYMTEALFVALPSRNETFSCFALEALASKLPIVTFDIPGLSWTDRTVALKAPAFDVDTYAKLLLATMQSKNIQTLKNKARIYARKFTWNDVADEFEEFFYLAYNGAQNKKAPMKGVAYEG